VVEDAAGGETIGDENDEDMEEIPVRDEMEI
jgi:hypothetical protein